MLRATRPWPDTRSRNALTQKQLNKWQCDRSSCRVTRCAPPGVVHLPLQRRTHLCRAATGGPDVVCVGEALFDFIADQKGLSREQVESWTPYAGGAPCNVATCLANLGVKTLFVSAFGKDERGDQLFQVIKDKGVLLDAVTRVDQPTRDVYVTRDESGDREFAGFGLPTEQYSDCFLDADQLPVEDIKGAKVLVCGTLGLAYPGSRAALRRAVEVAKEGGCKVLVDVNWRPVFWKDFDEARKEVLEFLRFADVVKVSDADLLWLYDLPLITALLNPCAVNERLPEVSGVLVTAGGEGAAFCWHSSSGEVSGFVPVFKVEVLDTTGAGDAFTAGLIWKVLQAGGLDAVSADPKLLKQAVVFASACGALTCTRAGAITGQPSLAECQQLYEQSKEWHQFW